MNKAKKLAAAMLAGSMMLAASPVLPAHFDMAATAYAAKGGAKMSIPKAAPAPKVAPAPKASTSESGSKSVSGGGETYKPSTDAKSLQKDAPSANSAAKNQTGATTPNTQQSSSRLGSIMRNVGLLAGGMFLGSMLSHLFGMGGGFFADALGLIMNLLMLVVLFYAARYLWNRFRGQKGKQRTEPLETRRYEGGRQTIDITPDTTVQDITPKEAGYDPKRTADRYRSL